MGIWERVYSAARGSLERRVGKGERVPAFLFLLGSANFWPRLEGGRGKRWSVGYSGSEQEEPAQGEEREMLPPRTAGLGVF